MGRRCPVRADRRRRGRVGRPLDAERRRGRGADNEPWHVNDPGDTRSLQLPAGASATTDVVCVGVDTPTIRLFARSTGTTASSALRVEVRFIGPLGAPVRLPIGLIRPTGGSWTPTRTLYVVANLLPLLPGERTPVTFSFVPIGAGTWTVDDVHLDPFRTG